MDLREHVAAGAAAAVLELGQDPRRSAQRVRVVLDSVVVDVQPEPREQLVEVVVVLLLLGLTEHDQTAAA